LNVLAATPLEIIFMVTFQKSPFKATIWGDRVLELEHLNLL
jgi:hypothetical protein